MSKQAESQLNQTNIDLNNLAEPEYSAVMDLIEVKRVFEKNDIEFWLMSGTLLGCMSTGRILDGDRDIDVGTMAINREKLTIALSELKSVGFMVKERFDPIKGSMKGMVTIKRGKMPMDIKLYEVIDEYATRSIHKSGSKVGIIAWELIDIFHFKKLNTFSIFRDYKVGFLTYPMVLLSRILPESVNYQFIRWLTRIWLKSGRYGMVVFPMKYFSKLNKANFYGVEFLTPNYLDEYFVDEYGEEWNKDTDDNKGGWQKRSHIEYTKSLSEDFKGDEDLLKRCKAVNYI